MGTTIEAQLTLTEPIFANDTLNGDQNEPQQGIYETSSTQEYAAGTRLIYPRTGRVFRYGRAGSTALAKAYMTQSEGNEAKLVEELQDTSGTSVEVGDIEICVDITTGITLVEDELTDGFLVVNKATGIGDIYKIRANKVRSTDTLMDVLLDSAIRTAWDATTEITILKNPFWDVVVMPTTAAERPAGVPLVAVTANYWCWLQTGGPCPMYVDSSANCVVGEPAGYPAAPGVAGAISAIGADTDLQWGIPRYIATSGEVALIDLTLESC